MALIKGLELAVLASLGLDESLGATMPAGAGTTEAGHASFLKFRLQDVSKDLNATTYTEDYASRDKFDLDDCKIVLDSLSDTNPTKTQYLPLYNQLLATYYIKVQALSAADQQKLVQQKMSDAASSDPTKNKTNPVDAVTPTSSAARTSVAAGAATMTAAPVVQQQAVAASPLQPLIDFMTASKIPNVPNYIPVVAAVGIVGIVAYIATRKRR